MSDSNLRFNHSLGLFPGFSAEASKGQQIAFGCDLSHHGDHPLQGDGSSLQQQNASVQGAEPTHLFLKRLPASMWYLVENKPEFWEFLFLQSGLKHIIEKAKPEWEHAIKFGMDENICNDWLFHKLDQLASDIDRLDQLWTTDLKIALGPPGEPTDVGKMCSFFSKVSAVVENLIGWEEEMGAFMDHPVYGGVASYIGGESKYLLEGLLSFKMQLDQAIPHFSEGRAVDLVFPMHLPDNWAKKSLVAIKALLATSTELRGVASGRVKVARGANQLGSFGLRSIQENVEAGIFLEDDLYWSANQHGWRPLKDLNKSALTNALKP